MTDRISHPLTEILSFAMKVLPGGRAYCVLARRYVRTSGNQACMSKETEGRIANAGGSCEAADFHSKEKKVLPGGRAYCVLARRYVRTSGNQACMSKETEGRIANAGGSCEAADFHSKEKKVLPGGRAYCVLARRYVRTSGNQACMSKETEGRIANAGGSCEAADFHSKEKKVLPGGRAYCVLARRYVRTSDT